MPRLARPAGLLALALACVAPAAGADPIRFATGLGLVRPDERIPEARLQGSLEGRAGRLVAGLRGRTVPAPDRAADLDLYLGLRPTTGPLALDVTYTRSLSETAPECCGTLGVDLSRTLGPAALGGALRLDPRQAVARAEARAAVALGRRTRVTGTLGGDYDARSAGGNAGVRVGFDAARDLGPARLDLRLSEASHAPARAELSLALGF
jgi:hypothetical protein